jgi:hypothetical protein
MQRTIQYHSALGAHHLAKDPGIKHLPLQLDFLTGLSLLVRVGNSISATLTLNSGAPEGCVLSPLLFSLFTYDSNTIKFSDGGRPDHSETA